MKLRRPHFEGIRSSWNGTGGRHGWRVRKEHAHSIDIPGIGAGVQLISGVVANQFFALSNASKVDRRVFGACRSLLQLYCL